MSDAPNQISRDREVDPAVLTLEERDALRAVVEAGCNAAASALSELIGGTPVTLEVVEMRAVPPAQVEARLHTDGGLLWGIRLALTGAADGALLLAYAEDDAYRLSAILAGDRATTTAGTLSEVGASALAELGNVLASAYLSAVATATGLVLLPSVPALVSGDARALAASFRETIDPSEHLLLLETRLSASDPHRLHGHLLIAAHPRGVGSLLDALGLHDSAP